MLLAHYFAYGTILHTDDLHTLLLTASGKYLTIDAIDALGVLAVRNLVDTGSDTVGIGILCSDVVQTEEGRGGHTPAVPTGTG